MKIEKLNQLHNKAHSESDSSDSSYFSESNSEEIEEEKDFNSSKEQKELLEINIENVPMKADYYKVDLTKVKLMLYDYEKNVIRVLNDCSFCNWFKFVCFCKSYFRNE